MKDKVTWRPRGLNAKKWRSASQTRGAANLLPRTKAPAKRQRAATLQPLRRGEKAS
jgi:hypothetical protein